VDGCEFVEFDVGVVDVCLVVKAWINDFELCYILISVVISKWLGNIDDDSKGVFLVPVSFGFGKKGSSFKPTSFKDIEKNFERSLDTSEKSKVEDLRDWSRDFFAGNSLKHVTWWSDLREPTEEDLTASKNKFVANEVDLLLRTIKVLKDKKACEFTDHVGQKYALFLQAPPVLAKDDVIKLRCVNVIFTPEGRIIQLTKNSSCLIIPDHFFDAKLFSTKGAKGTPSQSAVKTPARGSKTPMSTKRAACSLYPFLENYDYEQSILCQSKKGKGQGTLIKKNYVHKAPTSVKDLFGILENPTVYEHNRFVVSGYVLGMSDYKLNKVVKKMDSNGKIYEFDEDTTKVKGGVKHVYHYVMYMKDSSVENVDKNLNVYVLTNEGDQNLFDLWNVLPGEGDTDGWKGLSKGDVSEWENRFKGLKSNDNKGKFVVELLITNTGKPFLKLYDTVFV